MSLRIAPTPISSGSPSELVVLLLLTDGAGEEVGDTVVEVGQGRSGGVQRADLSLQGAQPVQEAMGADLGGGAQRVTTECGGLF